MQQTDIDKARSEIDRLDNQIIECLQERARWAQRIGEAKAAQEHSAYAPHRERAVIDRVRAAAGPGPLKSEHLVSIYRQVISACRDLERSLRVGYFGPPATFTHQAALERFGDSADFVAEETIAEVFSATQSGRVDLGVVPLENSTEGPVLLTLDNLIETDLKVCGEIVLPISLNLLSRVALSEIQTLYSIPIALGQCRNWVSGHLPQVKIVDAASTARAAILAADDPAGAAVGPALAASQYGLNLVERDIQDLSSNYTRFYVLSRTALSEPTGRDKSGLVFSIRDRVGALRDVADVFARRSINMSSIQSRPTRRRAWDYMFFVELAGHERDPLVREALDELEAHCAFLKVLGSWPAE